MQNDPRKPSIVLAQIGPPRRSLGISRGGSEPPINWRRGLFRVWLLTSSAWILGWVVYLAIYGIRGGFNDPNEFFVLPVLLLGPPIALLLFGAMTRWAFKGFAADKDETAP